MESNNHDPKAYAEYNRQAVELEERISAMRELPESEQPKNLLEGLVMLGVPVTTNK